MSVRLWIYDKDCKVAHEYGTNQHDSLVLDENGALRYYNLQNGCGSPETYEFCDESGNVIKRDYPNNKVDVGGDLRGKCTYCKYRFEENSEECKTCARSITLNDNFKVDKVRFEKDLGMIFKVFDETEESQNENNN